MSGLPYYRRYPEDALNGMADLSPAQRGVYNTLLDLIYAAGGEIEDNDQRLASRNNCSTRFFRKTKDELVALGKIWIVDGRIGNGRSAKELDHQHLLRVKQSQGGKAGASARWNLPAAPVSNPPQSDPPPPENRKNSGKTAEKTQKKRGKIERKMIEKTPDPMGDNKTSMGEPSATRWPLRTQNLDLPLPAAPEPRFREPASPINGAGSRPHRDEEPLPPGLIAPPRKGRDQRTPEQRSAWMAYVRGRQDAARAAASAALGGLPSGSNQAPTEAVDEGSGEPSNVVALRKTGTEP